MKSHKTNLTELLQKEQKIWVYIDARQSRKFLKFAKDNGFKWFTGREISLDDSCWLVVQMSVDKSIANVPAMHRVFDINRDTACKVDFSKIKRRAGYICL